MVYIFSIAQIKKNNGKLCGFLVTDSKREKKGEIFFIFYMYETFTNVLTYKYLSNKLNVNILLRSVIL